MCLIIENEKDLKRKIAKKDIPVIKMIRRNGDPVFRQYTRNGKFPAYKEGETRTSDIHIYRGLRSKRHASQKGLHSAVCEESALLHYYGHVRGDGDVAVVNMVIPKGAAYYSTVVEGITFYVSTHLKWPKAKKGAAKCA